MYRKSIIKRLVSLIKNPTRVIIILNNFGLLNLNWISDRIFIKIQYKAMTGRELNLLFPKTFSEKIQWLKLNGNLQNYSCLVDKYEVRKYIVETIGERYLIPLIGIWDKFDDIDFKKLPEQFVLKCTHDCNSAIICKNKTTFNTEYAKTRINKCLLRNYYYSGREKQYKNIKPRIICEKYMVDVSGVELKDYKIYCFDGVPKVIQVIYDRLTVCKSNLYDVNWNYISVAKTYPTDPNRSISKPSNLVEMLNIASILSRNRIFVRVDLYLVSEKIYFGELTFTPAAGNGKFEPTEFDQIMGSWIELPNMSVV